MPGMMAGKCRRGKMKLLLENPNPTTGVRFFVPAHFAAHTPARAIREANNGQRTTDNGRSHRFFDFARAMIVFHSLSVTGCTESRLPLRSNSMPESAGMVFKNGRDRGGTIGRTALIDT